MSRQAVLLKLDAARLREDEIDRLKKQAQQERDQLEQTLSDIDNATGANNVLQANSGQPAVERTPSIQEDRAPDMEYDHDTSYHGKYYMLMHDSTRSETDKPEKELVGSRPVSPVGPRSSTSLNQAPGLQLLLDAASAQNSGKSAHAEQDKACSDIDDHSRYLLKEQLKHEITTEIHGYISYHVESLRAFKDDLASKLNKSLTDQLVGAQKSLLTNYNSLLTDISSVRTRLESAEEDKKVLIARVANLEAELKDLKEHKLSSSKRDSFPLSLEAQCRKLQPKSHESLPAKVVEPQFPTFSDRRTTTARTGPIPKFSGENENWEVWYNRFLSIGRDREWTEADYLSEMKLLLIGSAGKFVFGELSSITRENYTLLVNALQEQFKEINLPEVLQQEFEEREQRPNESLREYMSSLRSLHCQAWPTEQGDARRTRLVSRFLRGISNPEVSRHISVHYPSCDVAKCVEEAMRYDALQRKYQSGADVARRVPGMDSRSSGSDNYTSNKFCSYCKRSGHWVSDCWKKQKDTGSTPSSPEKSQKQRSPNSKKGSPKGNRPWLPQGDQSGYSNNMPSMPFTNMQQMMQQMMPPFGFPGYNFPPFGYPPFNPMFPPFQGPSPQKHGKKGNRNSKWGQGKHQEQAARRVASDAQGESTAGATASAGPVNSTQKN